MSDIVDRLEAHMGRADIRDVLPDCREAAHEIQRLRSALKILHAAATDPLCNGGTPMFDQKQHASDLHDAIELAERELDRGPAWRNPSAGFIVAKPQGTTNE